MVLQAVDHTFEPYVEPAPRGVEESLPGTCSKELICATVEVQDVAVEYSQDGLEIWLSFQGFSKSIKSRESISYLAVGFDKLVERSQIVASNLDTFQSAS